jgi:hypothetical protein
VPKIRINITLSAMHVKAVADVLSRKNPRQRDAL